MIFFLFYNEYLLFTQVSDTSNLKIGKNLAVNRLQFINGQIMYDWLNLSFGTFKVHCKKEFLKM